MNTQYRKNLKAVLEASKNYIDKRIDDLQWQLGTYDLDIDTDNSVARLKTLHANTIKSMVDYIGGKSVKYNQLANLPDRDTTNAGVRILVSNQKLSFTGTATQNSGNTFIDSGLINLKQNHKYLVYATNDSQNFLMQAYTSDNTYISNIVAGTPRAIIQLTNYDNYKILMYKSFVADTTYNYETYFYFIDLTDIFGSGNEPSTVETAITLLKANGYKLDGTDTYSTGSLKHAVVSEVEYNPINVCNFNDLTVSDENVSHTINSANSLTIVNNTNQQARVVIANSFKGNYSISFKSSGGGLFAISSLGIGITITSGINTINNINFGGNNPISLYANANSTITISDFMITLGTTATSTYIPYAQPITKAIPSEVLADTRYGISYDDNNYNKLDCNTKHLSGEWNKRTYTTNEIQEVMVDYLNVKYFSLPKPTNYTTSSFATTGRLKCIGFDFLVATDFYTSANIGKIIPNANASVFWLGFPVGTTLAQAQAQLNGLEVIYEEKDSFDVDYSQYFDTNWNKVDLDKQYATCEMVVAEPIDMPNSITNLIEEVKA